MPTQRVGRFILFALIVGLTVTGTLALKATSDKRALASAYAKAQAALTALEQERAQVDQELAAARETMEGQTNSLTALEAELAQLQASLQQAQQEVSGLQQDNMSLGEQLASLAQEKQALEAKLSSLKELKLAIHAVRQKLRQGRWYAWSTYWKTRIDTQQEHDQEKLAQGNRGFVVRHGSSTVGTASMTKLQVRVLEPQPE